MLAPDFAILAFIGATFNYVFLLCSLYLSVLAEDLHLPKVSNFDVKSIENKGFTSDNLDGIDGVSHTETELSQPHEELETKENVVAAEDLFQLKIPLPR